MTNRIIWIDLIKVFAMSAVVFQHSVASIVLDFEKIEMHYWHIGNVYDSMIRMAVPLFFMVTGALLLNSKEEPLPVYFRKRILKVIVPLISWSLIYILFRKYALNTDMNVFKHLFASLFWPQQNHLWFLYALIGIYLFIPILKIFVNNSTRSLQVYFVVLWVFAVSIIPLFNEFSGHKLSNYMPMMSGYFGYLVLGYLLSKIEMSKKVLSISILFIVISTLVTIIGTAYLTQEAGKLIEFFYEYLSLSTMIQAISYFIILRYIGERIDNIDSKITSIIVSVSTASLGIYLIHPIMLWMLDKNDIGVYAINGYNPLYMVPLTAILAFIMSFIVVYFMQQMPIVKKIVP